MRACLRPRKSAADACALVSGRRRRGRADAGVRSHC
nr:hypothetical protein [Tanacetum cinerariifolium]